MAPEPASVPFPPPGTVPFPLPSSDGGGGTNDAFIKASRATKNSAFNSFSVLFSASASGMILLCVRSTDSRSVSANSGLS